MATLPTVAIVGATGAVGREMLAVLEQRHFPHADLRLFASERSAGASVRYRGEPRTIQPLTERSFDRIDIALFSAGSAVSRHFAPLAVRAGATVIDNSSAFRMDDGVPLVVPEVNAAAMARLANPRRPGIIANPNCSTIILLVPLSPLRVAFGIERIVVSTYQAASGAGAKGMAELQGQTRAVLSGAAPTPEVFHEPCAFNLFSHNTPVDPATGLNVEERKMIDETRKIWNDPLVRISPTCIRVPVLRAHSESINVTFQRPATLDQVRQCLAAAPGVRLVDDRAANLFPTPLKASGEDDVLVGRLRPDPSSAPVPRTSTESRAAPGSAPHNRSAPCLSFDLFISGDQLRKGAALNAVQIAELLRE